MPHARWVRSCRTTTRRRFQRSVARGRARGGASLGELELGALLLQLIREAGEHGLRMDPELTMLGEGHPQSRPGGEDPDPGFEPLAALKRHAAAIM